MPQPVNSRRISVTISEYCTPLSQILPHHMRKVGRCKLASPSSWCLTIQPHVLPSGCSAALQPAYRAHRMHSHGGQDDRPRGLREERPFQVPDPGLHRQRLRRVQPLLPLLLCRLHEAVHRAPGKMGRVRRRQGQCPRGPGEADPGEDARPGLGERCLRPLPGRGGDVPADPKLPGDPQEAPLAGDHPDQIRRWSSGIWMSCASLRTSRSASRSPPRTKRSGFCSSRARPR